MNELPREHAKRNKEIIRLRSEGRKLSEISKMFGISGSRVKQIVDRAKEKEKSRARERTYQYQPYGGRGFWPIKPELTDTWSAYEIRCLKRLGELWPNLS